MPLKTPIENAVSMYCPDWQVGAAGETDIATVNPETLTDATPADFEFRYIDISSVSEGKINWNSVETVRFADSPSRARRILRPGDTLICTVRPMLKSHAFAEWKEDDGFVCSTGFAVVRSGEKLNPQFLKHLPFAEQIGRQLVAWQCGTNYPAVNERDIHKLRLPLPLPNEQAAIARLLDAVDTAIARTREAVARVRTVKDAVLQQFFYQALGETAYADRPIKTLPIGWALVPTETLLDAEPKNGVSPNATSKPPGIPTFSIAAVRHGKVLLENQEHLKYGQLPDKIADAYRVRKGDVLIVRGNANLDLVGKAGMIDRFPDGCIYPDITKRVVFRKSGEHTVTPEYAVLAWNHSIVHNQILRRAKTSNGTLKINNRDVKQIILPVPTPKEQHDIVDLTTALNRKIDGLGEVVIAYEQLKRSLMHDLLTGKVRVNNLNLAPLENSYERSRLC